MAVTRTIRPQTLADVILPVRRGTGEALVDAGLVVAGAALTALAAQLRFTMPWTEVPYTGQTAAVLLVGTTLGWRRGLASMLLYVLAGVAGAPVFNGGESGVSQLLGVTGGYLVGFVIAAALVGWLAQRGWDRSMARAAGLMLLGNLAIYVVGIPVLAVVAGLAPLDAAWRGAGVFLPWDLFKVAVAAGLLPVAWRLAGHRS